MKSFSRADRVAGLIQRTVSEILLKEIKDPRLEMAVVSAVRMTGDLKIARVYFSITGGPDRAEAALAGFRSATGYIKRMLADQVELRYMPSLEFYYDESFDYGERIDNLLKSIHDSSGSDHTPPED